LKLPEYGTVVSKHVGVNIVSRESIDIYRCISWLSQKQYKDAWYEHWNSL